MLHFSIRTKASDSLKVIISVSKKVSKKAVVRNLIKRRIRPIMKKFKLEPKEYLIIARAGAEKVKGKELEEELSRMISSAKN
jgi:ribonuclease P protein component